MSEHALAMFDDKDTSDVEVVEDEQQQDDGVLAGQDTDSLEEDLANRAIDVVIDGAIRRIKEKKTRGEISSRLHARLKEEKVSFL